MFELASEALDLKLKHGLAKYSTQATPTASESASESGSGNDVADDVVPMQPVPVQPAQGQPVTAAMSWLGEQLDGDGGAGAP